METIIAPDGSTSTKYGADAREKGNIVMLAIFELSGAACPEFNAHVLGIARAIKEGAAQRDATRYGVSRRSTKNFYKHWMQQAARAATLGAARCMLAQVETLKAKAAKLAAPRR